MTTLPLGHQAYSRQYAGEPEIRLVNRYLEVAPTNQVEQAALISRPGSVALAAGVSGLVRANFSKVGLFGGDLFSTVGSSLFRISTATTIPISGTLANVNNGYVYATWMKGIGYEFLFVSDGQTLQYYTSHAMGTLTLAGGSITDKDAGGQVIEIGGVYYCWSATVNAAGQVGTSANPYRARLGSAVADGFGLTGDQSSLSAMALLLNYSGVSGGDYGTAVPGPSAVVSAAGPSIQTAPTTLVLTALADLATGNTVTTTIFAGAFLTWGSATLTGGGSQALQTVPGMAAGEVPASITNLSGSVLVNVGGTNKFYWINPGETRIDPLNFASKESNPDNISQMVTIGDQAVIMGDGSTENWYATGNFAAPFAPVDGRVYRRGTLAGTAVEVGDSVILVGDDLKVYSIGYGYGGTAQFGVHRISTHGIEERIRTQVRSLQGWPA
jgi:hypothetical protein